MKPIKQFRYHSLPAIHFRVFYALEGGKSSFFGENGDNDRPIMAECGVFWSLSYLKVKS